MKDSFFNIIDTFWQVNVGEYITNLQENPLRLISLIIDLAIVIFLAYKLIKITKKSRVWQLIKGIALLTKITSIILVAIEFGFMSDKLKL